MIPDAAYYGDCFDIISKWENEGIKEVADLIYGDPPFNSNRNYGAPTSKAQETDTGSMDAFVDMWTYDDKAIARTKRICKSVDHPASNLIQSLKDWLEEEDDGMLAYLSYMADRLWKLHGILKQTGSIYLHCDPFANYYLRLLLDAIFGKKNFRNEIVWHHPKIGIAKYKFTSNTDTIFCYSKSENYKFHPQTSGEPNELFARWERKIRGKKLYYREAKTINDSPAKSKIRVLKGKLGRKLKDNDVVVDFNLPENHKALDNVWKIPFLRGNSDESEGYPTQKPMALLDRIILASTNPGDVVLDPFCGCGTTMESAFRNGRQFVGIDVSVFSVYSVTKKRMKRCGIEIPIEGIPTNMAGARLLAKQDKFAFESWAGESLNFGNIGILSNKIQRCDGGIDGKGKLLGETEDGKDEVIVQVKGGGFAINDVKAFKETIQSKKRVAAGIFITLDGKGWSDGMEKIARSCGTFKMPNAQFDRDYRVMQHWPVENLFAEPEPLFPKLPVMINPLNNKPLNQERLEY